MRISFISKAIMCKFYFLNQSASLWEVHLGRRRGLLSAVMYLLFALEHSKPSLPLIILREVWRWPRTGTSPSRGQTLKLCIPLIFANAKFVLSRGLKISYYCASKDLEFFFFSKGLSVWCQQLHISSVLQVQQLARKVLPCVWKGSMNFDYMDQSNSSSSWIYNVSTHRQL